MERKKERKKKTGKKEAISALVVLHVSLVQVYINNY